jgi:uncharacterized membrane protein YfcA
VFLLPVQLAVLLPLGVWLCWRATMALETPRAQPMSERSVTVLALLVGVVGGIYGIGGGSILGPILVGAGMPVAVVAPAALAATLLTSLAGVGTYALLASSADPRSRDVHQRGCQQVTRHRQPRCS